MNITDEMVERAAIAIADYRYDDGWKTDWYKGDVRKFGDTMEEDFIGMARAALTAALSEA